MPPSPCQPRPGLAALLAPGPAAPSRQHQLHTLLRHALGTLVAAR